MVILFLIKSYGCCYVFDCHASTSFRLELNFLSLSFLCNRGDMHPALWGAKLGNSWRTTNDISDTWDR